MSHSRVSTYRPKIKLEQFDFRNKNYDNNGLLYIVNVGSIRCEFLEITSLVGITF